MKYFSLSDTIVYGSAHRLKISPSVLMVASVVAERKTYTLFYFECGSTAASSILSSIGLAKSTCNHDRFFPVSGQLTGALAGGIGATYVQLSQMRVSCSTSPSKPGYHNNVLTTILMAVVSWWTSWSNLSNSARTASGMTTRYLQ